MNIMNIVNILYVLALLMAILFGIYTRNLSPSLDIDSYATLIKKREYLQDGLMVGVANLKFNSGHKIEISYDGVLDANTGDKVTLKRKVTFSPRIKWHPRKEVSYEILEVDR